MTNSGNFDKKSLWILLALAISFTFLFSCNIHKKTSKTMPPVEKEEAVPPERKPAGSPEDETAAPHADRRETGARGEHAEPPETFIFG